MRVCVLSLTRDRLDYTKHCFGKLRELAGCPFDHYVFDQGSRDGTAQWLVEEKNAGRITFVHLSSENVGISRAMNRLLGLTGRYDVYVKFDNDCELVRDKTLDEATSWATHDLNGGPPLIVSPQIMGLNSPPAVEETQGELGFVGQLGGIFMAIPGWVFTHFRYDENNPKWGMDDVQLSQWFRNQGGRLAYMLNFPANHYETTEGQKATYPAYWDRKKTEMGIA